MELESLFVTPGIGMKTMWMEFELLQCYMFFRHKGADHSYKFTAIITVEPVSWDRENLTKST